MTKHSDLIARIEAADGCDKDLLCWAYEAVHGNHPVEEYCQPAGERGTRFLALLDAEAWLDAAMTLVPEGWQVGFEMGGVFDDLEDNEAWCWPRISTFDPDWQMGQQGYRDAPDGAHGHATTPALALCAAALRAQEASE